MVAVKLWGGLGNQMFQYAFGKYLSMLRNEPLYFFKVDASSAAKSIALTNFNVNLNLLPVGAIDSHLPLKGSGLEYRMQRKLAQKIPFLFTELFVEKSALTYYPCIASSYRIFDGYWQALQYINPIEDVLRQEFVLKQPLDFNHTVQLIEESESVSVHIRRGDYLDSNAKDVYAECDSAYYQNAIDFIRVSLSNPVFFVFSNDLDWVRENLKTLQGQHVYYVDNKEFAQNDCADFELMSKCKHNVIANSTFSWWAAWLNSNSNKIIVCPKRWYNNSLNSKIKNILPAEWNKM